MKRWILFLILLLCGSDLALADKIEVKNHKDPDADFYKGMQPHLIGGQPVDKAFFPGYVEVFSQDGKCSAQITGPKSLQTAAHCTEIDGTLSFRLIDGSSHTATCSIEDESDMAACVIRGDGVRLKFASFPDPGYLLSVGGIITKAGYGCIKRDGTGGNDGVLRVGEGKIIALEGFAASFADQGLYNRLKHSYADDRFFETQGGAIICYGDSGGAAFARLFDYETQKHILIGINSYTYVQDGRIINRDGLVNLTNGEVREWLEDWVDENSVEVCGINMSCGADEDPEDPRECDDLLKDYKEKADEAFDAYWKWVDQCQA